MSNRIATRFNRLQSTPCPGEQDGQDRQDRTFTTPNSRADAKTPIGTGRMGFWASTACTNRVKPPSCLSHLSYMSPAADNALAAADFPAALLTLDFETYFSASFSLSKLNVPEYVHAPEFLVLGLAICYPDGRTIFRRDVDEALRELQAEYGSRLDKATVVGHNLAFDGYVLRHRYGLSPAFLLDTASLARAVHPRADNSLGALARRYGLEPKGDILKDMAGVREPSPELWQRLAEYARHDASLAMQLALRLLPLFSRPKIELRVQDHTLRLGIERGLQFDANQAGGVLAAVRDGVKKSLDVAHIEEAEARGAAFVGTLGHALRRSGRSVPRKQGKRGPIPALAKNDEPARALLADSDPAVAALMRAHRAVQSAPQAVKRIERMRRITKATGGVLPSVLTYGAAHTGRFGGTGGINLQNLAKRAEGPAKELRKLLHAPAGALLVIADMSQIEARVLAGLAGEQRMLNQFAAHEDLYSTFASNAFQEDVRKPREDDTPDVARRLGVLRHVGKVCILGNGFGMGAATFERNLRADSMIARLFDSGILTPAKCAGLVGQYRRAYDRIPTFWRDLERAFREAVRGGTAEAGRILARGSVAGTVDLLLPSGRRIVYPDAKQDYDGALSYAGGISLYGGKLAENVTQAIARDVLVEVMLDAEGAGYPVHLHVHDEVVCMVDEARADGALNWLLARMRTAPAWAPDLPLDAEGRVSVTYGE